MPPAAASRSRWRRRPDRGNSHCGFFRGIVHIVRGGIDAAGRERHIVFERAASFADVAGKSLDEVGARALLVARVVSDLLSRPGGHVLGGVSRFLELFACHVGRGSQCVSGALLHFGSGVRDLILQVLRRARGLVQAVTHGVGQVQIAHDVFLSCAGLSKDPRPLSQRHRRPP